jgi:hypothetical protein
MTFIVKIILFFVLYYLLKSLFKGFKIKPNGKPDVKSKTSNYSKKTKSTMDIQDAEFEDIE